MQFIKNEKHIVISKFTYDVPDGEIVSRFGSLERFKEFLTHLPSDEWMDPVGNEPTATEESAFEEIIEYFTPDRDDYWLTEDKGGAEVSYEMT
jgi:hypothetical protein